MLQLIHWNERIMNRIITWDNKRIGIQLQTRKRSSYKLEPGTTSGLDSTIFFQKSTALAQSLFGCLMTVNRLLLNGKSITALDTIIKKFCLLTDAPFTLKLILRPRFKSSTSSVILTGSCVNRSSNFIYKKLLNINNIITNY